MNTNEYIPVANNLALTVRKEHRLMVIKRASRTHPHDKFRFCSQNQVQSPASATPLIYLTRLYFQGLILLDTDSLLTL